MNPGAGTVPNTGMPINTDNPIFIGKDNRELSPSAWLDEVAIYDTALPKERVLAHLVAGGGTLPYVDEVLRRRSYRSYV